ncbi:hypothetical protein [Entomoplasma ellychniae]|uniref:hypothetical protein n=1 Tax=Entomoplasma ellychniae TaxID=2114 RepID=UPI0015E20AD8|nr:hypothetical protein [Entomoplasma ellychniae]
MEFNLLHEVAKEINAALYTCNTYASCKKESTKTLMVSCVEQFQRKPVLRF